MSDQQDGSVQRELGSLGAKIDGLGVEIRFRFEEVSRAITKVQEDAAHDIRNVKQMVVAVDARIEKVDAKIEKVEAKIAVDPAAKAVIDKRYTDGIARVEALEDSALEARTERRTMRWIVGGLLTGLLTLTGAVVSHDGLHLFGH